MLELAHMNTQYIIQGISQIKSAIMQPQQSCGYRASWALLLPQRKVVLENAHGGAKGQLKQQYSKKAGKQGGKAQNKPKGRM